jgi:hypothetical protein
MKSVQLWLKPRRWPARMTLNFGEVSGVMPRAASR